LSRRKKERIYRRRRPFRALLRVLIGLILVVCVLAVVIFFWFQRYIVHTPDGVRLDVPFLRGISDEISEFDDEIPFEDPRETPEPTPDERSEPQMPTEPFRAVWVAESVIETIPGWSLSLGGLRADAVLIALSDETGRLRWDTDVEMASRFALSGENDLAPLLFDIGEEVSRVALLYGFRNQLMAQRNPPAALAGDWLDPRNIEIRDYIMELGLELGRLGFNEIVLTDVLFPLDFPVEADAAALISFLREFAAVLSTIDVSLSLMTRESDWYVPEDGTTSRRPSWAVLAEIITRFYCVLDVETTTDEERFDEFMQTVHTALGGSSHQFVPTGLGSGPELGNWMVRVE